jgi:parallel beta-helix repeat protein
MRLLPSFPFSLCALRLRSLGLLPTLLLALLIYLAIESGRAIAQATPPQSAVSNAAVSNAAVSDATVPAAQRLLYVNPATGSAQGNGSEATPFRSITQALQVASPQTIILLAAGTYSTATGESFPLVMKPDVTIQGDPTVTGQGFVIQGGGFFLSPTSARQNIAMLGANRAVLVGVTLTNPNLRGYGLWVESSDPIVLSNTFTGNRHDGISTVGTSAPLIQGNRFVQNGANGITIFGRSHPQVQENTFEATGFGINVSENATPLILQNRISRNRIGIVVQRFARPVIRANVIEGSQEDGIAAIAQAQPNLGTVSEPGNNVFLNNARHHINATAGRQIIPAFGNQGLGDRFTGQIDTAGTPTTLIASSSAHIPLNSPSHFAPVLIDQPPPAATARVTASRSVVPPSVAAAINIPVPQPEARPAVAPIPNPPNIPDPSPPTLQADLLPVPSEEVPVGNIGDLPTVNVFNNPLRRNGDTASGSDASAAASLRYRVVVEANSDRQQALVKSIAPNAFVTQERGRSLMQVGAFSNRDNAESAVRVLNQNGLRAKIEDMR